MWVGLETIIRELLAGFQTIIHIETYPDLNRFIHENFLSHNSQSHECKQRPKSLIFDTKLLDSSIFFAVRIRVHT